MSTVSSREEMCRSQIMEDIQSLGRGEVSHIRMIQMEKVVRAGVKGVMKRILVVQLWERSLPMRSEQQAIERVRMRV